jgi:acyl carrier protein
MDRNELLLVMDKLLKQPPGTIKGPETLQDIVEWDSLAILGFIALADEKFHSEISPVGLGQCQTVNDLLDLLSPAAGAKAA